MLLGIKQLIDMRIAALDGTIGHVFEFYFDDHSWVLRYLIAQTGNILTRRRVLLAKESFGQLVRTSTAFPVNLKKKQVRNSPDIQSTLPVSHQRAQQIYNYYGWPYYFGEIPAIDSASSPHPEEHHDSHLRRIRQIIKYTVISRTGKAGRVANLLLDNHNWTIPYLIIKTGPLISNQNVIVPTFLATIPDMKKPIIQIETSAQKIQTAPLFGSHTSEGDLIEETRSHFQT